ncbi:MAG: hypothetical protein AAGN66_27965 [Acidobacteriota bacterium]
MARGSEAAGSLEGADHQVAGALLVRVQIRMWEGEAVDKAAGRDLERAKGAKYESTTVKKKLVDSEELREVKRLGGQLRRWHYDETLKWEEGGDRLISAECFGPYMDGVKELKARFEAAVEEFVAAYPAAVRAAERELGSLFERTDYPVDVRGKFGVVLTASELRESEGLPEGLDLSIADRDWLEASAEERSRTCVVTARRDLWSKLFEAVAPLAGRLREPDAIFKRGTVQGLVDALDRMEGLNVFDDVRSRSAVGYLRGVVGKDVDALVEALRSDPRRRREVADKLEVASRTIATILGGLGEDG